VAVLGITSASVGLTLHAASTVIFAEVFSFSHSESLGNNEKKGKREKGNQNMNMPF